MEFRSKMETKRICRECRVVFLSVDGSPCPSCSRIKDDSPKVKNKKSKDSGVEVETVDRLFYNEDGSEVEA